MASFAGPALRVQHPSSTRRCSPLCTLPVARPLLRMHLLHHLFFLHACATGAMLKYMVPPQPTRLRPHAPRPHRGYHLLLLLAPLLHAAHGLSHHRHHRTLHSPMTCGITLFGFGPIFARPLEAGDGRRSPPLFLIT